MFGFRRGFNHNEESEFEGFGHRKHHHHFAGKSRGRGPFGGDFGEGGRKRQRRGDIKFILLELIKEQPRHGYDLIKALEERNSGFYRPSPGSVYPTLQLLEDEGHLRSETINGKRTYTITEMGEKLLAEREQEHANHGGDKEHFGRRGFGRHGFGGQGGEQDSSETLRNDLRHTTEASTKFWRAIPIHHQTRYDAKWIRLCGIALFMGSLTASISYQDGERHITNTPLLSPFPRWHTLPATRSSPTNNPLPLK